MQRDGSAWMDLREDSELEKCVEGWTREPPGAPEIFPSTSKILPLRLEVYVHLHAERERGRCGGGEEEGNRWMMHSSKDVCLS